MIVEMIDGAKRIRVNIPQKPCVCIRGDRDGYFTRTLSCVLTRDYIHSSENTFKESGYSDLHLPDRTLVAFDNQSAIKGEKGIIHIAGNVPEFHIIQYIAKGKIFSSYTTADARDIETITSEYSDSIPSYTWYRLIESVNEFVGFEFVHKNNDMLLFNYQTDNYSKEELEFIYTIISECYATPKDIRRIIIFSKLDDVMTREHWVSLVRYLSGITTNKNQVIIADFGITYAEINSITYVNI